MGRAPAFIGDLMADAPDQVGLRGDRVLWSLIRRRLARVAIPRDPADMVPLVHAAFAQETGRSLADAPDAFEVPNLHHGQGGISEGWVSGQYWRETCIGEIAARARG